MVKVVGVDPGLAGTGVGIVWGEELRVDGYAFGAVETEKGTPLAERLRTIHGKLLRLIEKEKPDLLVVEDVFSLPQNPKSGILLGKVAGVVLLAAGQAGITVCEVPVREVKKVLSGNGAASKEQLEKRVRHILRHKDPIRPFHASDAMGLALTGLYRYNGLCGAPGGRPGAGGSAGSRAT